MKLKTTILAAIAAMTGAASAASIGVSFGGDNAGGTGNGATGFLASTDTAGVVSQANWTNALGTGGTIANVANDSAAATTMDVTWGSGESWNWNTAVNTSDGQMLDGWISANTIGLAVTLDLSEIPYAAYDVYLYSGHDRQDGAQFTITEGASAFPSTTLIESVDAAALAATPFTYANGTNGTGNYALWSGLSASALNISVVSNTNRIAVSGIQIVEVIPEPSSALFVGLAGMALIFRRRK